MTRLVRPLAVLFLRHTARGPLVDALPAEPARRSFLARVQGRLIKVVGRAVGLVLTPGAKARIQEWLINTFHIEVDWQPTERLEARFVEALKRLEDDVGVDDLGDYLEFGVYQGSSLACMHRAVTGLGLDRMRLFGFDSFEGLPESATFDGVWSPGQFRADETFTRKRLDRAGVDWQRTELIPGFYDQVLDDALVQRLGLRKASVVMIDCDLYTSTRDALAFCEPLIHDHTIFFFDDWHATGDDRGEKRAFREFLARHPTLRAEDLGSYHQVSKIFLVSRAAVFEHAEVEVPELLGSRLMALMPFALDALSVV